MTNESENEVMHWADQAAKKVVELHGDKEQYVVAAGVTPSGQIHIGNFREIITVDLIAKALEHAGKKVRFIYSWDDYDVFRKVPVNMPQPEKLKSFLRMSITTVPDTFDCKHESYAKHNEAPIEEGLPVVNINPEFLYQQSMYSSCKYAEEIKKAMQKRTKIKEILDKYRKEPLEDDWYPSSIFCSKCNKDTTKITQYDEEYDVSYSCECGHEETIDIRKNGIIKLKWRVDWPMRWDYEKVDFEPAGKDHFAAGGSRQSGVEILKEVWNVEAPYGFMYEWIGIKGGKQFSSSTGNVTTLQDVLNIYEPSIVRHLFAGSRPNAEFSISFDLDVLKIYEDFDKCERIYFGKEEATEKEVIKQKRIYELSSVKLPKKMPFQPSFRHLTNVLQIYEMNIEKAMCEYDLKTTEDKARFKQRAECCKNWIENYADESFKFTVNFEVPSDLELDEKQKESIKKIIDVLKTDVNNEKELHEKIYNVSQELEIKASELFKAAYKVLISKERGPRLASFILALGKERVIGLFEKV